MQTQTISRMRTGKIAIPMGRSATMLLMTGYVSGNATRRLILLALLVREPQTMEDLARASGTTQPNVSKALRGMEQAGFVTVVRRKGRRGSEVRLTPKGRETALLLRD